MEAQGGDDQMLTRIRGLFRWLTGLVKLSREELKQAGIHLDMLRD
jgi:hypothetical protein